MSLVSSSGSPTEPALAEGTGQQLALFGEESYFNYLITNNLNVLI